MHCLLIKTLKLKINQKNTGIKEKLGREAKYLIQKMTCQSSIESMMIQTK